MNHVEVTDPSCSFGDLTERQRAFCAEVSHAKVNKEIAAALHVSEDTVKVYLHRLFKRVGVHNRVELAVRYALWERGIC